MLYCNLMFTEFLRVSLNLDCNVECLELLNWSVRSLFQVRNSESCRVSGLLYNSSIYWRKLIFGKNALNICLGLGCDGSFLDSSVCLFTLLAPFLFVNWTKWFLIEPPAALCLPRRQIRFRLL